MRQRAMIALAISCDPSLLIADEPTTALDVTTEAQILELLKQLQAELGMAIIFITHNFGVVADIADRVSVMYLGRMVETASVDDIFYAPKHPYTQALLRSIPRLGVDQGRRLPTIPGMVPDPFSVPDGCAFNPRCTHMVPRLCDVTVPPEKMFGLQMSRCHIAEQFVAAEEPAYV
jgi:peptide/nickel transport system ATP-binding protein